MKNKEILSITAAILTHSVITHLPPGTLTPVRVPENVAKEATNLYESIFRSLEGLHRGK